MRLAEKLKRALWRRLNLSWSLPSGIVLRERDHSDWYICHEIFLSGQYDPAIELAFSKQSGVLRFLDLGANVGFFSLRVAHLLKSRNRQFSGTLLEGNPRTAEELRTRIIADNQLSQLRVINALAGKRSGSARISDPYISGNSTIKDGNGTLVEFADLDKLCPEPIDLLKCDIEGAEDSLIDEYPELLNRTSVLVMELHFKLADVPRCLARLKELGFASRQLDSGQDIETRMFWRSSVLPAS
jgi:FkbM family methyltransferase